MPQLLSAFPNDTELFVDLFAGGCNVGVNANETASFDSFDLDRVDAGDFVYCDPPYLITTGNYNDGKRGFGDWDEVHERKLLALLDELNRRGVRFALSNLLCHKGQDNHLLQQWSQLYRVIDIDSDYSNASYHGKDRHALSREVLVVNFL